MISTYSRSPQIRSTRFLAPRRGFSLIEVAIALVIFVIGALAIIRIFPGALSVIGNNGDQQIATNLNRSQLTDLKSEQVAALPGSTPVPGFADRATFNSIPFATFNNSNADGTLNISSWLTATPPSLDHSADFKDTNSSVIGVTRFNETLPDTQGIETGNSLSSLSRYRTVVGEKTRARNLSVYNSTGSYALTQFPVSVQLQGNPPKLLPVKPVVSQEVVLNDVRTKPDGTLDFSRTRLDDNDAIVGPYTVSAGSMLYVSYRYYNGSGNIWGVREEAIPFNTLDLKTATAKVTPPTGAARTDAARVNGSGVIVDAIIPEIVEVKLRVYIGQGEFGDPADQTDPLPQVADARRGLVLLPNGLSADRPVILDYVADWSFLLKDGVPSAAANATYPAFPPQPPAPTHLVYRQISLGTPFIEDQAPVSLYSLLIESDTAYLSAYGTVSPDPPAIDRLVRATDAAKPELREDELRSGKVTFIVDEDVPVRARVAYQTRDNWVQQLSVAANTYKPFVSGNSEPWRNYGLGNDSYIYFHAGEAGKTISISYTILDRSGITPVPRSFVDRPFVIDSTLVNAAGLVPTGFLQGFYGRPGDPAQIARVKLTNAVGGDLTPADLISVQAVNGVSVTARTAYINGTQYAQKIDTTTRGAK